MRIIFTTVLVLLFSLPVVAQDSLARRETPKVDYTPQVFGAVKAKFELSTSNGEQRFNVRNSRIGVKGAVSNRMRYAVQIDFNNEGKISILDSYATYTVGGFELSLGQQQYKFSTDLDRGPSSNMFSNRSFIAKYLTTYIGSDVSDGKESYYVKNIGSRDIGALISYDFPKDLPLKLSVGAFNGSGANNPEWSRTMNFVAKLTIGARSGFGGAISYYGGNTPVLTKVEQGADGLKNVDFEQDINMWGGELHYVGRKFLIEAEYAQRRLQNDGLEMLHAAHVQGYYRFTLPSNQFADHVSPHLRWDMGRGIDFMNTQTKMQEKFNSNRITASVNIGLSEKIFRSEIRFGYEKFFVDDYASDFHVNPMLHDKMTIEFIASF